MVEIAASNVSLDLHEKLDAYRRASVKECLAWHTEEQEPRQDRASRFRGSLEASLRCIMRK